MGEALAKTHLLTTEFAMSASWQTKLLEKWREDRCKTPQQRQAEAEAAFARQEAARVAADESFFAKYPQLRPTAERLAALQKGTCAHCSVRYPEWEHVEHYYCSWECATKEADAAAAAK